MTAIYPPSLDPSWAEELILKHHQPGHKKPKPPKDAKQTKPKLKKGK